MVRVRKHVPPVTLRLRDRQHRRASVTLGALVAIGLAATAHARPPVVHFETPTAPVTASTTAPDPTPPAPSGEPSAAPTTAAPVRPTSSATRSVTPPTRSTSRATSKKPTP